MARLCFGTTEYIGERGICRSCKDRIECSKEEPKRIRKRKSITRTEW